MHEAVVEELANCSSHTMVKELDQKLAAQMAPTKELLAACTSAVKGLVTAAKEQKRAKAPSPGASKGSGKGKKSSGGGKGGMGGKGQHPPLQAAESSQHVALSGDVLMAFCDESDNGWIPLESKTLEGSQEKFDGVMDLSCPMVVQAASLGEVI